MFAQIIQGRVHDPAGLHHLLNRWVGELSPGAPGWLGTTAGVTDDGEFIAVVRFDDEAQARRNSDRAEQGAWWEEAAKHFDSPPQFRDCPQVDLVAGGGRDDAGFVQVIQSRFSDRAAVDDAMARLDAFQENRERMRPDLLGVVVAWHPDGEGMTEVAYFTTEAEARENEARLDAGTVPADVRRAFEEWRAVTTDVRYLDLRDPWLSSPTH